VLAAAALAAIAFAFVALGRPRDFVQTLPLNFAFLFDNNKLSLRCINFDMDHRLGPFLNGNRNDATAPSATRDNFGSGGGIDAALKFLDATPAPIDFMEDITSGMQHSLLSPGSKRSSSPFTHSQMQHRGTIQIQPKLQKKQREGKFHSAKSRAQSSDATMEGRSGAPPRLDRDPRLVREISDTRLCDEEDDDGSLVPAPRLTREHSDPTNTRGSDVVKRSSPVPRQQQTYNFSLYAEDFAPECLLGESEILSNPPSPSLSPSIGQEVDAMDDAELGRALFAWAASQTAVSDGSSPVPGSPQSDTASPPPPRPRSPNRMELGMVTDGRSSTGGGGVDKASIVV
jgi:hypothetical protein